RILLVSAVFKFRTVKVGVGLSFFDPDFVLLLSDVLVSLVSCRKARKSFPFRACLYDLTCPNLLVWFFAILMTKRESFGISSGFFFLIFACLTSWKGALIKLTKCFSSLVNFKSAPRGI